MDIKNENNKKRNKVQNPVVVEETPSSQDKNDIKSKEVSNTTSIDDLFQMVKKKKTESLQVEPSQEQSIVMPSKQKKKKAINELKPVTSSIQSQLQHGTISSEYTPIISPAPPIHRVDKETGLPVYKAHLMLIGKGGGTDLCPFDCNCCF